jgi:hypothetical protein
MKQLISLLLIVAAIWGSSSCKKDETVQETVNTGLTTLLQGSFVNGSGHSTTGNVKLAKDASGKKFLVFENLKTDSGPDLKLYLAEDVKATNFSEIASKVSNGSYQVEVPSSVDTDKKRKVLIWCKAFSVLFGSADLK